MKITPSVIEGFVKSLLISQFDAPAPIPDLHREIWELCCSPNELVAIAAPRGHAKSTAVSLAYCLAEVLFRSSAFVLLVSDTEGQAVEFLRDIKKQLQDNEDLIALFGIKHMSQWTKDTESDIIVRCEDGYEFRIIAKGSEQKVRGMKWNNKRPDLIIGDDLENDEIVMNEDRRKKFREWVIKALLPCRAPKGRVRIVGTILHLDSFLSRITPMDGDRMTYFETELKQVSLNQRAMWKSVIYKAHVGTHPSEIKKASDILWSERFSKADFLMKYQAAADMGHSEAYAQEYLNRPIDEATAVFRKSDFVPMTEDDRDKIATGKMPLQYYCGVDLAITENQRADYSVFHVVGINSDGIMFHIDTIRDRFDGRQIVNTVIMLQQRYELQWMAIEQDKTGKTILPFMKEEMLRKGIFVNIIPIIPHADKVARASSITARMRIGAVKFNKHADYYPTLESEFLTFPRGRKDDQVDAYSCIGLALTKLNQTQTYEEIARDELEDAERSSTTGNDGRSRICGY